MLIKYFEIQNLTTVWSVWMIQIGEVKNATYQVEYTKIISHKVASSPPMHERVSILWWYSWNICM
jgi:hypothetical protein